MKLSKTEEELMNHLWKLETAFMKDLLECYPEPRPASTTIATLLKRMQEKGYVGYNQMGRSRQYYPIVEKKDYFSTYINGLIRKFFNDSPAQFASFFTRETKLSDAELEELQDMIHDELKRRQS
ncbi:BlaI/MecI/CopY family transcriptional regulator [Rhodohalobacter mucosus]|uniref:Penicillinase repressor n=1 Tax=Rhodohalobacter mucosus TaxID=2079485 RepID=A0A316TSE8_9BACT|nr:BlaI/MecI/CopY family transcriptional regulator [Rhodohalobacter mucosus]PWN07320.1 penicillinase repressor [Rhodohalobacter mucosus]